MVGAPTLDGVDGAVDEDLGVEAGEVPGPLVEHGGTVLTGMHLAPAVPGSDYRRPGVQPVRFAHASRRGMISVNHGSLASA